MQATFIIVVMVIYYEFCLILTPKTGDSKKFKCSFSLEVTVKFKETVLPWNDFSERETDYIVGHQFFVFLFHDQPRTQISCITLYNNICVLHPHVIIYLVLEDQSLLKHDVLLLQIFLLKVVKYFKKHFVTECNKRNH